MDVSLCLNLLKSLYFKLLILSLLILIVKTKIYSLLDQRSFFSHITILYTNNNKINNVMNNKHNKFNNLFNYLSNSPIILFKKFNIYTRTSIFHSLKVYMEDPQLLL